MLATGGNGGAANSGGSGGIAGAAGAVSKCATPPDLGVRFVGRVDGCDTRGARYAWSGSGFIGRFEGSGVSVRLFDTPNQYTVIVDGEVAPTLKTKAGEGSYVLASGLGSGEHSIEFYRRTEASFGVSVVEAIEVSDGALLPPPAEASRRIEVIGDSISCGYGNEGMAPCMFSADTENHYLAYPSVLARNLNAELSTVAWSGKGVIFNYNGNRVSPMPTLYDRVVADDRDNLWSFASKPDAVIINLGTNDYSTATTPTDAMFVEAYQGLLTRVRAAYPNAFILCTVGPMLSGAQLANAREGIAAAVMARVNAGDSKIKAYEMTTPNGTPWGCDAHPNLPTQEAIANELAAELRASLGW